VRLSEAALLLATPIRTSAGRAGFLHAGLTLLASLVILGTVYAVTTVYERRAAENGIKTEARSLAMAETEGGLAALARQIDGHVASDPAGLTLYLLLDRDGRVIAGNTSLIAPKAGWQSFVIDRANTRATMLWASALRCRVAPCSSLADLRGSLRSLRS
jgi:hypothetical protein